VERDGDSLGDVGPGSTVSFAAVHARMLAHQRARAEGRGADRLHLFTPSPVVTLGSGADESALLLPRAELAARGVAVERVDRGGEATYHGPGQRVGYLTLALAPGERDLHALLRAIESALIAVLSDLGIAARRREGLTGVWVDERKIAAIGLSVRRWVTGHGFSLGVRGDSRSELAPFSWIVPCGIAGCATTSIEAETGRGPDLDSLDAALAAALSSRLGRRLAP